jgi:hypothetical protein
VVEAPGYADASARYAFPGEVTVKLVPGSVVSGAVVDRSGHPMPGLTVRGGQRTTVSDADGRFSLDRLPAGVYPIDASGPGWFGRLPEALALGLARTTSDVRLVVARAFDIVGRVHAGPALPPAGTTIEIGDREAAVDADGRFTLAGVAPGIVHLFVHHSVSANFFTAGDPVVVEVTDHALELDLDLGPRHDVTAEVVDEEGRPIPGARAEGEVKMGRTRVFSTCTTTAAGTCTFSGVPAGSFEVSDDEAHVARGSVPTAAPIRLVSQRLATVRGRLVTADGRPPSPRLVQAKWDSYRSDPQGRFTLSISPGTDELRIYPDRLLTQGNGKGSVRNGMDEVEQTVSVTAVAGEEKDITIQLPAEHARLEGRVVESDGSPAEDCLVTLGPAEGRNDGWARFEPGLDMATTDADGRFSFAGLVASRPYSLIAFRSNGEQAVIPAAVPGAPVTLRLLRLASLEVSVAGNLDRMRAVNVEVLAPDGARLAWGQDHDDARTVFRFPDLPIQTVTVRLENGFWGDPIPAKSTEARLTLQSGRNVLSLSMP